MPKKPPEPVNELPPDEKPQGSNIQWVGGYWAWDEEAAAFLWVSGFWRNFPPGKQWVPGYWAQQEDGWQWVPGLWTDAGVTELQYLPTPPPTIDAGPSTPAPGADSNYVPGCWIYRETRYWWRPGFWLNYQPGYVWMPACYRWSPLGYLFCEGRWDYALRSRGVLYAPVTIAAQVLEEPRWAYQPRCVINNGALVRSLFVGPHQCQYYFGDYFDAGHRRQGYTPWIDYRVSRYSNDPLFSYYRWEYRSHDWEKPLRAVYTQRQAGTYPRPAHTLVEQNTLIQNFQKSKTTNVENIVQNITIAAPLNQAKRTSLALQRIPEQRLAQERQVAQDYRKAHLERQKAESHLRTEDATPLKDSDKPRVAKFQTAKPPQPTKGDVPVAGLKPPPPAPAPPKHEEKPVPKDEPVKPSVLPAKPGVRQPEPMPKTDPKKPEPQPEPKPEPKKEPKADPKKEPKAAPKPEPKKEPAPKQEPKPVPKPEPEPKPKPEPKKEPAPKQDPKPAPKPEPAPKAEPKPTPKPELAPHPEPKPAPHGPPKSEPAPHPDPKPRPAPKPEPAPKLVPPPPVSKEAPKPVPPPPAPKKD
ncbi:MAG: hypothetical protein K2R98_18885 [Gemmataceae bacterium]|nr:hypothetical protein [Gemmataceae bacterium]